MIRRKRMPMQAPSPGSAPAWMLSLRQVAQATGWCLLIAAGLAVIAATPIAGPLTFDPAEPNSLVIKHVLYGVIAAFLLLPGFLGGYDGPDDVQRWAEAQAYGMAEHRETMHEHEKGIDLEYRLVVATPAFVA